MKLIILGAGASHACPPPYTRADLPLPLLSDLPRILNKDRVVEGHFYVWFGECLDRLLKVADNDIEALLTTIFELEEYFFRPAQEASLDDDIAGQIIASSALEDFFINEPDFRRALGVLELLRVFRAEDAQKASWLSPRNFLVFFQGAIHEYFHASIQRQPCPLHLKLFEQLSHGDCVASFNYDEIADYALLRAGKLGPLSFEHLGFESINFPEGTPRFGARNQFLKLHGGFNWLNQNRTDHKEPYLVGMEGLRLGSAGGPEVHYSLLLSNVPANAGNMAHSLLLPFHCKEIIYHRVPIFARHMDAFRRALHGAREIYLVGKNFKNSDAELNGMIRWATWGGERNLHIIDPNIDIEFHCKLFNARLSSRYSSFAEYAADYR